MSEEDRIGSLESLRDVQPPPSLVPGVMRRIAEPRPVTLWTWLRQPRTIELRFRLSPVEGALGVAFVGLLLFVAVGSRETNPSQMVAATAQESVVVVRFTLAAQGARKVAIAGDFNGWDPERTLLVDQDGSGSFAATVTLPPGAHEYMFVVDGAWVTDPAAAERRPDGFGRNNAVLRL
jgi:hypothetical protein